MNTYENTEVQKVLEEKYNVKFTIEQVAADDTDAMNLYWATGNIPDVCVFRNLDGASLFRQGLIRSFPVEWLEQYAPDYMKTIYDFMGNGDQALGKKMTLSQIAVDGKVIFVPRDSLTNHVGMLMCARQDWLDNLKLSLPTTTEELHSVMTAFTKDDPDGDGAADTYGMHGSGSRSMRFGYVYASQQWWPASYYMDDSGKVTYSSATDKCKEMLTLIRSWYEEGIVDPEFITDNRQLQRDKWAQGKFGILVDHPWWFALNTPGNVQSMLLDADSKAKLTFMEPFADSTGTRYVNTWYPDCVSDASLVFGKDCPDEAIQKMLTIWNDAASDWDFYLKYSYGTEGKDYTLDADGRIVKSEASQSDEYAASFGGLYDFAPIGTPRDWYLEKICPKVEGDLYSYSLSYKPFYMNNNFVLPTLDTATAQKAADVQTVADEYYASAISGETNLTTDWDAYLAKLDAAGLKDVIAAYEAGGVK